MYCYYRGGLTKSLQSELYRLEESKVFTVINVHGVNICM